MAPLIVHAARVAREESRRTRNDSGRLRLVSRSNARLVEARIAKATATIAVTRERRSLPMASPWSGLHWLLEDDSLERILLPLD